MTSGTKKVFCMALFIGFTYSFYYLSFISTIRNNLDESGHETALSRFQSLFYTLDMHTSPEFSHFIIRRTNQQFHLCETLEVDIYARNQNNEPKTNGGDYLWVWIYNTEFRASAAADDIIDHQNGSYTAKFQLHWAGNTTIAVGLVHISEAITVLKRVRDEHPARSSYSGKFSHNDITRIVPCHINKNMFINSATSPKKFCNFTDRITGFPWFCVKPDTLSCDTYVEHTVSETNHQTHLQMMLSKEERLLFSQSAFLTSRQTQSHVMVYATANEATLSTCKPQLLPECSHGKLSRTRDGVAGFYYQNRWYSLVCNNKFFTTTQKRECLRNHNIRFWGDSTLRQWYEQIVDHLLANGLELHEAKNFKFGPHVGFHKEYNINIHYRHHGFPIRNDWTLVKDILYVPNMIDEIDGKGNEIILLSLWAHFTATNLEYYRERWQTIKDAILRLKLRNPGARVVIKTANTREMTGIDYDNWYAKELDEIMRNIMSGLDDVIILDVWDMTIGHQSGYKIHPAGDVIRQEIRMLMSFLCSETS